MIQVSIPKESFVKPIDNVQRQHVVERTLDYIRRGGDHFDITIEPIEVQFDLRGRTAGMYKVQGSHRVIRYNPHIFTKFFDENVTVTVPHEAAHYIADMVYGMANIRPHGGEWKSIMKLFDADPSRTCDFDLSGIPRRIHQRFDYKCQCNKHKLTSRRRNQILDGKKKYYCCKCKTELKPN